MRIVFYSSGDTSRTGHHWWVDPGDGLRDGESFEEAAARELREETGLVVRIDTWVWTRRYVFECEGRCFDQYERYFMPARETQGAPVRRDGWVDGHRWWSSDEILHAPDDFAPRRLGS